MNGLFTLNGHGAHSNVNLPGDPAASGFGDAVGALVTGLAAGIHKLVDAAENAGAVDPIDTIPVLPAAAAGVVFFEVVAAAAAVAAVAYAVDELWMLQKRLGLMISLKGVKPQCC